MPLSSLIPGQECVIMEVSGNIIPRRLVPYETERFCGAFAGQVLRRSLLPISPPRASRPWKSAAAASPADAHCKPLELLKDETQAAGLQAIPWTRHRSGHRRPVRAWQRRASRPGRGAKRPIPSLKTPCCWRRSWAWKRVVTFSGCPGGCPEDKHSQLGDLPLAGRLSARFWNISGTKC